MNEYEEMIKDFDERIEALKQASFEKLEYWRGNYEAYRYVKTIIEQELMVDEDEGTDKCTSESLE